MATTWVDPALMRRLQMMGSDMSRCLSCGQCTAICPVGVELLPRTLFRYALLGAYNRLQESWDAIFSCLLCGMCEIHCPNGVSVARNMRLIRAYLLEQALEV